MKHDIKPIEFTATEMNEMELETVAAGKDNRRRPRR